MQGSQGRQSDPSGCAEEERRDTLTGKVDSVLCPGGGGGGLWVLDVSIGTQLLFLWTLYTHIQTTYWEEMVTRQKGTWWSDVFCLLVWPATSGSHDTRSWPRCLLLWAGIVCVCVCVRARACVYVHPHCI